MISMESLAKWAERIYLETDIGRGIATSLSGVIGLVAYLIFSDWVIAVFSTVIAFPIIRIIATGINDKIVRRINRKSDIDEASHIYDRLSYEEKEVVNRFVEAGGSVLTWNQVNKLGLSMNSIESLIQRELVWPSVTADGLTETFVIDSSLYDVGQQRYGENVDF